jgi:aryl-alcohol dehydrogenase-like predicted oxidoreductase
VACAVVGTTRPAHLAEDVAASGMVLPAEISARIRRTQAAFG